MKSFMTPLFKTDVPNKHACTHASYPHTHTHLCKPDKCTLAHTHTKPLPSRQKCMTIAVNDGSSFKFQK